MSLTAPSQFLADYPLIICESLAILNQWLWWKMVNESLAGLHHCLHLDYLFWAGHFLTDINHWNPFLLFHQQRHHVSWQEINFLIYPLVLKTFYSDAIWKHEASLFEFVQCCLAQLILVDSMNFLWVNCFLKISNVILGFFGCVILFLDMDCYQRILSCLDWLS